MSAPNQKIIRGSYKAPCDKNNLYTATNLDTLQKVMNDLKGETFKMWMYLGKNQERYSFELSQKDAAAWGIKKDSYYKAVNALIDKGYLVPIKEGSNVFTFFESGFSEIQKNEEYENKGISEKQKNISEIQKNISEKPERNITNTTNIIQFKKEEKGLNEESKKLLRELNDDAVAGKFDEYEMELLNNLSTWIRENIEEAAAEIYEEVAATYEIIYALARDVG